MLDMLKVFAIYTETLFVSYYVSYNNDVVYEKIVKYKQVQFILYLLLQLIIL